MLFKNRYRIESSRLKNYDYSNHGAYFITIVTKYRTCFFGDIVNDKMVLNDFGKIADKFWKEIPEHFPHAILDEYIIMPNHVHGIIILDNNVETPDDCVETPKLGVSTGMEIVKRQPIGVIINQFKRICTITIRELDINFGWQSRFHDHVIRNEKSLNRIRQYIIDNPKNWLSDKLNCD